MSKSPEAGEQFPLALSQLFKKYPNSRLQYIFIRVKELCCLLVVDSEGSSLCVRVKESSINIKIQY